MVRRWVLILKLFLLTACNTDIKSATSNSYSDFSQSVFDAKVSAFSLSNCTDYATGASVNMTASWDPATKSMILLRPGDKLEASYKRAASAIYLNSQGLITNDAYTGYELMHDSTGKTVIAVQMSLNVDCASAGNAFYDSGFLNAFGQVFRNYYLIPPACTASLKGIADIKLIDFLPNKIRCTP